jgi:hypothetical protein
MRPNWGTKAMLTRRIRLVSPAPSTATSAGQDQPGEKS